MSKQRIKIDNIPTSNLSINNDYKLESLTPRTEEEIMSYLAFEEKFGNELEMSDLEIFKLLNEKELDVYLNSVNDENIFRQAVENNESKLVAMILKLRPELKAIQCLSQEQNVNLINFPEDKPGYNIFSREPELLGNDELYKNLN